MFKTKSCFVEEDYTYRRVGRSQVEGRLLCTCRESSGGSRDVCGSGDERGHLPSGGRHPPLGPTNARSGQRKGLAATTELACAIIARAHMCMHACTCTATFTCAHVPAKRMARPGGRPRSAARRIREGAPHPPRIDDAAVDRSYTHARHFASACFCIWVNGACGSWPNAASASQSARLFRHTARSPFLLPIC